MGNSPALALITALTGADDFVPERMELRLASELGHVDSLALDAYYDVNDHFRVAITSSSDARRELGAGRGLCLHDCDEKYAGLSGEAQIKAGDHLVGRGAIDTSRFAPTAVAVELGLDIHYATGRYHAVLSPVLRLGIARRDLANRDNAGALAQFAVDLTDNVGVFGEGRIGIDVDALDDTPMLGVAGGAYLHVGGYAVSAKVGDNNVGLFGGVAICYVL
ncbi:MAG: hypothetical protein QM831_27845 [Kofleriaceae bacterium]